MNKGDLIDLVSAQLDITKADAGKAVDAVFAAITEGIRTDGKVTIAGFGAFQRKQRAGRTGINPSTKQPIEIKPTTTCAFRPAPAMKDTLVDEIAGRTGEVQGVSAMSA